MRPNDIALASALQQKLLSYTTYDLLGIQDPSMLDCLIRQMIDSTRRIKYVKTIAAKNLSSVVADVNSTGFDPLKAAVWHARQGNTDEAFWLVFLATHFGKNKKTEWNLLKAVYSELNGQSAWTWARASKDPISFIKWLQTNQGHLKAAGKFGNHRKYESLSATAQRGTGAAVNSYIEWVSTFRDHQGLISNAKNAVGSNPHALFAFLYKEMSSVISFGRTGKFDYLTMVGKMGLANIEPDSTYMSGATGPASGARLLFNGNKDSKVGRTKLNVMLKDLEGYLGQFFGMQILEDSLCNWQKSPDEYKYFKG